MGSWSFDITGGPGANPVLPGLLLLDLDWSILKPMNKFFLWAAVIGVLMIIGPVIAANFTWEIKEWFQDFVQQFGRKMRGEA